MADESQAKVDKKIRRVENRINEIYGQARLDIENKIDEFNRGFEARNSVHLQELADGVITQSQYDAWLRGQVFQSEQWAAKRDQICSILDTANQQATTIVNGGTIGAFAEGANWTAYSLEHTAGVNFGFGLYDRATVTRLVADNPQILPEWRIDEPKEYVWNQRLVNNCVTQGIIQGESLDDIATRIATATSNQNRNLALTHARTAMTGAQNAGRVQRLQDAKKMGLKVVKEWLATLDAHTRDSHRDMDGEQRPVGDQWHPMKFSNGCRYPADPQGPAHEVYNCRCTLTGDLADFPDAYKRYDNIDGKPIEAMSYREWEKTKTPVKPVEVVSASVPFDKRKVSDLLHEIKNMQNKVNSMSSDLEYAKSHGSFGGMSYEQMEEVYQGNVSKLDELQNQLQPMLQIGEEFNQEQWDTILQMQRLRLEDYRQSARTWWGTLSGNERSSVQDYTGSSYIQMNDTLRFGNDHGERNRVRIENLRTALGRDEARISSDVILRRGVRSDALGGMFGSEIADAILRGDDSVVGAVGSELAFMSASPVAGGGFTQEVELVIHAPTGTQAVYVDEFSRHRGEEEMLVQCGYRYRIERTEHFYGMTKVYLTLLL